MSMDRREGAPAKFHNSSNGHFRKTHRHVQPLPCQVTFRLVCHASVIGGLIGKGGSIISQISAETGCGIRCQEIMPGSEHRVVFMQGSGLVDRRIVFSDGGVEEQGGEVSSAQEAVIRVFDRVWEVEAEGDGMAYSGLLAEKALVKAVIGREGRNVKRIITETGAKIRMLPPPSCAAQGDELIQITGCTLAVKKALISVTSILRDRPAMGNEDRPALGNDIGISRGTVEMVQLEESVRHEEFSDPHRELFADLYSFCPPSTTDSIDSVSKFHSSLTSADGGSTSDMKRSRLEVVFRLICSNVAAGGVIGKRGAMVRDLENQSGASIKFAASSMGSRERVATISSLEDPDNWDSPAQKAVSLVFARSVEVDHQWEFSQRINKVAGVTAKLLVGSDLVAYLTANGEEVSEIMNRTGADIQILVEKQIQDYASENDSIVQISGKYQCVQNALFKVTCRLRENLVSVQELNEVKMRNCAGVWETNPPGLHQLLHSRCLSGGVRNTTSAGSHQCLYQALDSGEYNELAKRVALCGLSDTTRETGHTMALTNDKLGSTAIAGDSELNSEKKPAFANTLVEITVPENVFSCIYGEDGNNLRQLKEISGAKIDVSDPCPGKSGKIEGKVIISGTPDQAKTAQSLLHAFIKSFQ